VYEEQNENTTKFNINNRRSICTARAVQIIASGELRARKV
jgi:hypothetical protein